ncbi:GNAT family N-acetyltransferase [Virgibacillus xinjiangensis]|uniref:GNAT family N-acetyltransferase n=1 Tax=Virgibacillus xinjiangensis TaxID=393090 RepID=A0ABV7CSS7_9BACI
MGNIGKHSEMGVYMIRQAEVLDTFHVHEILREAAEWLNRKGIDQWNFLLEQVEDKNTKEDIEDGKVYLVLDQGFHPAATFTLSTTQNNWDVDLWGMKQDDNAYYLHRLAVASAYHRRHLGASLLEWMDKNLPEQAKLRLDCVADNPVLNHFYQHAGFSWKGYAESPEGEFSLYEKVVGR